MAGYTRLTGYWLFANAHKHYKNDKGPYRFYFPKADKDWNLMLEHYQSLWDEVARDIRNSTEAKMFFAADVLLKMLGDDYWLFKSTLLQFRKRMCYELYLKTRPMLLESMEICCN